MGTGTSSVMGPEGEGGGHPTGLGDLPEDCAAGVLAHLEPSEICRAAGLSRTFRGAASADSVWETKLPRNYRILLALAADEKNPYKKSRLCKKEIYAQLCRPIPFDGGILGREEQRRDLCIISSKALLITGIDDRRYWNFLATEESRFYSVAYLQPTWWLEVDGELDFCFPAGFYSLFFRLHLVPAAKRLGRRICLSEHIDGWDIKPVRFNCQRQMASVLDPSAAWTSLGTGSCTMQVTSMWRTLMSRPTSNSPWIKLTARTLKAGYELTLISYILADLGRERTSTLTR